MSIENFHREYVKRRIPVILENCLDYKTVSTLENVTPEHIIQSLLLTETPDVVPQEHFSWTHDTFPQDDSKEELRNVLRTKNLLRRFIKLSALHQNTSCGVTSGSADLCSVLAGSWRPPPMPSDLWPSLGYPNNLGWMLLSGEGL